MRSGVRAVALLAGRARPPLAGVALMASLVLLVGGVASAGLVHPFLGSFGSFANPQAVTVDQSTGDVFVIDVGNATVQKFDSLGNPTDFSAVGSNTLDGAGGADLTPQGGFSFDANSAAELAIDNSGGPADGDLYVANSFAGVVDVFDSTGTFVGQIDGSAASPQSGGETCGVTTDPSGNIYAASYNGHVDKYTPTDPDPAHVTFAGQLENLSGTCNIAADGFGSIYVSTWPTGPLTKYDASQLGQATPSGTQIDATSTAVAVDPATNDVYINQGDHVTQRDSSGALLGQSGIGHLTSSSFGVGVNGASGLLYVSDAGSGSVKQFGPSVNVDPPAVTIDQPSNITSTGATFTGTVNPSGTDPLNHTSWHFEYSTDGGSHWTSTSGGDAGTGTSPVSVSDTTTSLLPNQQVQVHLVATNAAGSTTSSVVSFTTVAILADATAQPAQEIAPTHVALPALINPHNAPTTYYFEYGRTTAYGTSVPVTHDGDAGSGNGVHFVVQRISGLQPASVYHFRPVASNAAGTTLGQDQVFTTTAPPAGSNQRARIPGSGFLPDGRGWEKVSPGDKNGGDILADSQRVRVASDGNAVDFSSLAAFGDAIGTSVATDYMSTRSSTGWVTHAITPPQKPTTVKPLLATVQSLYVGSFSSDLSTGVFFAWSPITSDANVANVVNLYRRKDLTTPGSGSYELLSACPLCQSTTTPLPGPIGNSNNAGAPLIAGTSADFGHVLFESQEPLTSEAPAGCNNNLIDTNQCPGNLYEWDHGTVRSVGILPNDACATPPCPSPSGSQAGEGAGSFQAATRYTPHTISADGSRIFFRVPNNPNLYMRVAHTATVRLNASERTPLDPNGTSNATYWDASVDGSRIFFTSSEALTDDAPADGDHKLYMYDASKPDADPHNLTLLSPDTEPAGGGNVTAVTGVSDDGHYVYFAASGQLIAGQPVTGINAGLLYVWHDGTIRYIGSVTGSDLNENGTNNDWFFNSRVSRVTPDGSHLLFSSADPVTGPTGYDQTCHVQGGTLCRQLYVYSYASKRLACMSCNPSGAPSTGIASISERTNNGIAFTTSSQNHPMSDDGRRVFFNSPDALVPQDVNGKVDVYEYDVPTGTLHLITTGRDRSDAFFVNASNSGDDAFFLTRAQLAGSDVDNSYDLYDARVDGGFPDPPPIQPTCTGEACRAPQGSAPGSVTPGSSLVTSNPPAKPKTKSKPKAKACRKGYVHKKVHRKTICTKKKKHKQDHHKSTIAQRGKRVKPAHGRPR